MIEKFNQIRWLRILQILLDIILITIALYLSYQLRFDGLIAPKYFNQFKLFLPLFITLQIICNWLSGVYRRLWRYTGLTEVMELGQSISMTLLILICLRAFNILTYHHTQLSYAIIIVYSLVSSLLLSTPRIFRRLQIEHRLRRHWRQPIRKRALIIGAGDAGQMVVKELQQRPDLGVDIVGIIDDDKSKHHKKIGANAVIGATDKLEYFIDSFAIDQVIIAIPSAPGEKVREILNICKDLSVETKILPGIFELINGQVTVNQLREVSLEDLLGREPVKLDHESIASFIAGKTILITGAGGSIGSELARQVFNFEPKTLLLLGKGENSIFAIFEELKIRPYPVNLIPIIADIRDYDRLQNIFNNYQIDVVFHAAAHKHVYLMELNPADAISNNVIGTYNVASLSKQHNVNTFVLVSTDKVVNPTSIMGCTKRMAEIIIQQLNTDSATKFVAVRFGNVLASRGSVIPIWKEQIARGGPVTVTHKDVIRYFMLIPEAVGLILQSGALSEGKGEVYVLDMGKPVKIFDLAQDLIKFSGLRPDVDIKIEFTGLKQGEKLYEELLTNEEGLAKTCNNKIFVGYPKALDESCVKNYLKELTNFAKANDENKIRDFFKKTIEGNLIK